MRPRKGDREWDRLMKKSMYRMGDGSNDKDGGNSKEWWVSE